jgi:2-dehydro-3-deoxyphosphogluconate aldolase/(4S)-4-hydroxy-2-oxoglutarate aldolase
LVSPTFDPAVVALAAREMVGMLPGAGTVTEAQAAFAAGADFVKIFPASMWAPRVVTDVLQALPYLPLVPTGGIKLAEVVKWLEAGAVAVGLGGGLTTGTGAEIEERVRQLLSTLAVRRLAAALGGPKVTSNSISRREPS